MKPPPTQPAAVPESHPIMRWNPFPGLGMNPASNGLHVRYEDHAAALSAAPPAAQRDELLQASLDFISTLTGMTPPPIEVAPPEVFAPFYAFVDRVQAITAQPNAAADGWMPIETAPKDGTAIDLFSRHGHREAGAAWGLPPHECGEMGRYCDSEWHGYEPGWVTDFWGEPQPDSEFTHWRRPPAPPTLNARKTQRRPRWRAIMTQTSTQQPAAVPEAQYLCKAWGETDLPVVAIVSGLDAVREFLVAEWLGDADQEHDDGTKALPAAMEDMQDEWRREGEDAPWSVEFEIGGISVQKVWRSAVNAAAPAAPQAEQPGPDEFILRERDEAEEFIDAVLDEVLGADRPEWSSAYGRPQALAEVQERIGALYAPAAIKAWGRFEAAMAQAEQPGAAPDLLTAASAAYELLSTTLRVPDSKYHVVTALAAAIAAPGAAAPAPAPAAAPDALDAARYRRVRLGRWWSVIDGVGDHLSGDALDAAVDRVLAAQGQEGGAA